ncbi:hypothetical protein QDS91_05745 [Methylobacterium brachiatum]|nr:hypothetical protein [Methylobacterium brachiatum]MDH2309095.1 hypothetical protein [Methylobacterium brachiatum]
MDLLFDGVGRGFERDQEAVAELVQLLAEGWIASCKGLIEGRVHGRAQPPPRVQEGLQLDAPSPQGGIGYPFQIGERTVDRRVERLAAIAGGLSMDPVVLRLLEKRGHVPAALDPELRQTREQIAIDRHIGGDLICQIRARLASEQLRGRQADRHGTDERDNRDNDKAKRKPRHDQTPELSDPDAYLSVARKATIFLLAVAKTIYNTKVSRLVCLYYCGQIFEIQRIIARSTSRIVRVLDVSSARDRGHRYATGA